MPLNPILSQVIEANIASNAPGFSDGTVAQARAAVSEMAKGFGTGPAMKEVRDIEIEGDDHAIRARLFIPDADPLGVIVHYHGGGWITGGLDEFDTLASFIAAGTDCAVLLVAYRLAPEHPFPAAFEDAVHAARWMDENCERLFGQKLPLILSGDSSGANLVAATSPLLTSQIDIAMQVLIYPVTDTDFESSSYKEFSEGYLLTRKDMIWFFGHYAGDNLSDPRVAPLKSTDVTKSPPTWICTAEYDVLRTDGENYAKKLIDAGVSVEITRYNGMVHAFAPMINILDEARMMIRDLSGSVKKILR